MKTILSLFLFFCLLTASCGQSQSKDSTSEHPQIVFTGANLVTMEDEEILHNMDVVIKGDRIEKIGRTGEINIPAGAKVIDGSEKYLMPGLAEMHGHVPPIQSSDFPERYVEDVLFLYLAGGVTTVRGMLGHENQLLLKGSVNKGELLGPNLYLAGPSFSGNSINSVDEVTDKVRSQVEEGWDLLKVHPGLTLEEFEAMAEVANEADIAFAGHIPEDVGLVNAINLGQETIDHLDGYITYMNATDVPVSESELHRAVELTVENNVWVVPTQALWETLIGAADHEKLKNYDELKYMPPQVVKGWLNFLEEGQKNSAYYSGESAIIHAENRQQLLKALQDGGAKILLGTDAPQLFSVPGFSMKHEVKIMEEAGLTPYEIIKSGTYNVGEYFVDKDQFGTIKEGSRADLILLPGNPLTDLSVVVNHNGVLIRGHWLSREEINQKLKEIEQAYN